MVAARQARACRAFSHMHKRRDVIGARILTALRRPGNVDEILRHATDEVVEVSLPW